MRSRGLTITTAALAVVGLALLGFETAEALRSVALGTTGTVLLYLGLGLALIAAGLTVVDLTTAPAPDAAGETPVPELVDESAS